MRHYNAAKAFGKKFACGASVTKAATGKEEIDVQGDFSEEIAAMIVEKFQVWGAAVASSSTPA